MTSALREDLSLRLQQALLENQIRLEPVQAHAQQEFAPENDAARLSYLRDLLESDDDELQAENLQGGQRSYDEMLTELTSLVSSSASSSSPIPGPGMSLSFEPAAGIGAEAFANWSTDTSCSSLSSPNVWVDNADRMFSGYEVQAEEFFNQEAFEDPHGNISSSSPGAGGVRTAASFPSSQNEACESLFNPSSPEVDAVNYLESLLMSCARAVAARDSARVYKLVGELRSLTSPPKTSLQHVALQFTDALVARLTGYGAQMHSTMYRQEVTQKEAVICQMNLPTLRATERYASQVILERCREANRVHIVDYGILYGCQWPSLIKALSEREEGPPLMMITGVDFPHLLQAVQQSGKRLVEFARSCGVSLKYHAIGTSSWELEQPRHHLENELLIVNCKLRMRNLREEGFPESPRVLFFRNIVKMKAALFVQCVVSVELSSPFFMHRFQAAWTNMSARNEYVFESMRIIDESKVYHLSKFMAKTLMNILACEGPDRIERMSSYNTWNSLAVRAGLESLPVSQESILMATSAWSGLPGFTFGVDNNWLLLGWKTEVMNAMSAWRPKPVQEKVLPGRRRRNVRAPKCQALFLKA